MSAAIIVIMKLMPFLFTTADEVGKLIAHLQDHQRTLAQAEADQQAGDAKFDADLAAAGIPPTNQAQL